MTLKKVLAGLRKKYDLEEIHIITPSKVVFSASIEKWDTTSMIFHKMKVEKVEITNRMIFNDRKVFFFIPEIEL